MRLAKFYLPTRDPNAPVMAVNPTTISEVLPVTGLASPADPQSVVVVRVHDQFARHQVSGSVDSVTREIDNALNYSPS